MIFFLEVGVIIDGCQQHFLMVHTIAINCKPLYSAMPRARTDCIKCLKAYIEQALRSFYILQYDVV